TVTKANECIRTWIEDGDLSQDLDNETRKLLLEYAKLEPEAMEEHIVQIKFTFLHLDLYHSPEKGAIIIGLHFGSWSAGMWGPVKESPIFVHSEETMKDSWAQCAQETRTLWDFRCVVKYVDYYPDLDSKACNLR
ncbi:hypothetical protein N7486_007193, partial [Penicillium sp. IBT 16267x]